MNQLPFSSINYGTCTEPEARMFTEAILDVTIKGVGNGQTSIFPCQIFQYKKGVNDKEGTPNYDLFKKAIECTSKRLYPNYVNCDWSGDQGYNPDDPRTYPSTMGAIAGKEHLYIKKEDKVYDITIQDLFEYVKTGTLKNARPCKVFANKPRVVMAGNKHIQQVSNIKPGAGVYSITYLPTDVSYIGSSSDVCRRFAEHKSKIKGTGGIDGGACFGDTCLDNYRFDIIEYTDDYKNKEKELIETVENINFKGISEKYYKVKTHSSTVDDRPIIRMNPSIPQELYNIDEDIKVLDKDNKWVKIRHIFKNDKQNTPLMMHVYYNEYGSEYCLTCTEDHPIYNGKDFTRADKLKVGDYVYRFDGEKFPITAISWHWEAMDSYDIGTETGSFIASDIITHNCRTFSAFDINSPDEAHSHMKDGRGNVAPATIILPTLAMEAKKKEEHNQTKATDEFMKILDKAIDDCVGELIERFNWICAQNPASARFMYENKTFFSYGDDFEKEGIRGALKHGTLAVGQIGLAECLQILLDCDHTTKKGMDFAKKIEQLYFDKCADYKQKLKLNLGVYYSPGESLCYTAMKKFKAKYGIIPNVSDHDYFTNSIHVPVWKEISPFEKIDIESQLTGYHRAGCITYVEIGDNAKNNLPALEQIVKYAMDKDIPYFALNLPLSHCTECGSDENIGFEDSCPICGANAEKVEHLARVTGYLSTDYRHFNAGKRSEVKQRYTHVNKLKDWKK